MTDETDETGGNPDEGQLEVLVEPPDSEIARLRDRVDALEKEKKETYDRLLRTAADLDNFRKRSRKSEDDAYRRGREQMLKDLLPDRKSVV